MNHSDDESTSIDFSEKAVSQTLENVFNACGKPQNTIPLKLLENKHKLQRKLSHIGAAIAGIGIIIISIAIISFLYSTMQRVPVMEEENQAERQANSEPPVITDVYIENDNCVLYLKAGTFPIDYETIQIVNTDSEEQLEFSHEGEVIKIPYDGVVQNIKVSVADVQEKEFEFTLKIQ